MNVQPLTIPREAAQAALRQYKAHRGTYDKQDWEIERIYRQIARGKTVISVNQAIRDAGLDELGRPRLAVGRADASNVLCRLMNAGYDSSYFSFVAGRNWSARWEIKLPFPGASRNVQASALVPRIPPQYRPKQTALRSYHILWEADWTSVPLDPYLLKRIGKDAWLVLAAWELTTVELAVVRAHAAQ